MGRANGMSRLRLIESAVILGVVSAMRDLVARATSSGLELIVGKRIVSRVRAQADLRAARTALGA